MFGGSDADMGSVALLRFAGTGIRAVIGSECANTPSRRVCLVGLEPTQHAIICVWSAAHFIAHHKRITARILFAETPGANPSVLDAIDYSLLRLGMRRLPQVSR